MASDHATIVVHVEASPELRELIASICDERIRVAAERAAAVRIARCTGECFRKMAAKFGRRAYKRFNPKCGGRD